MGWASSPLEPPLFVRSLSSAGIFGNSGSHIALVLLDGFLHRLMGALSEKERFQWLRGEVSVPFAHQHIEFWRYLIVTPVALFIHFFSRMDWLSVACREVCRPLS